MSDISRRVAKALGYSTVYGETFYHEEISNSERSYRTWKVMRHGEWQYDVMTYDENVALASLPDYEHDANVGIAALDALTDVIQWQLRRSIGADNTPVYSCYISTYDAEIDEYGATPALAICASIEAWAKARVT